MSILDETEYLKLQQLVQDLQIGTAVASVGGDGSARSLLAGVERDAKERMMTLERDGLVSGEGESRNKANALKYEVASLVVAEREIRLTAAERETFAGFMDKPFFARSDFDELEQFYSGAYDRLSEPGKDQMSSRVWEGVRRGEYQFSELPETVKEKEAARLRELLNASSLRPDLAAISERDRGDFIRDFDSGNLEEAYRTLDQRSFTENVAKIDGLNQTNVVVGKASEAQNVLDNLDDPKPETPAQEKSSATAERDSFDILSDSSEIGSYDPTSLSAPPGTGGRKL